MSQQIDRLLVSRGPALVTFDGGSFLSKEDIVVDLSKAGKDLPSSAYGPLARIGTGVSGETKFTPVGEFEHLGILWQHALTPINRTIMGTAADKPLLIQPLDVTQRQVTFHSAGVSKMPDLHFTATDTLIGEVGFKLVGKNNTPIDDANRLYTPAANALGAVPYDPDKLLVQAYQNRWISAGTFVLTYGANTTAAIAFDADAAAVDAAFSLLASVVAAGGATVTGNLDDGWTITFDAVGDRTAITGAVTGLPGGTSVLPEVVQGGTVGLPEIVRVRLSPWSNFAARDGVKVAFAQSNTDQSSDAIGVYDVTLSSLGVTLSAEPQGLDWEAVLEAAGVQGPTSVPGRKISSAHNFDVIGDGVFFRLYGAGIEKAGLVYSSSKQRIPELQWSASRTVAAGGALNPLFYIGTEAPA